MEDPEAECRRRLEERAAMGGVDELAAAAELVHGKLSRVPVAIIRGEYVASEDAAVSQLIRPAEKDMFR